MMTVTGVETGISVVIPTHNPKPDLLPGLFHALAAQTLASGRWELVVVDNASIPALAPDFSPLTRLGIPCRLVQESKPGLTHARLAGFAAAVHSLIVLLDDDNLPRSDFLSRCLEFAVAHPEVGVFGGRSLPRYETPPPPWFASTGLGLGCRDLGNQPIFGRATPRPETYPRCAPIGAGMVLRREISRRYTEHVAACPDALTDRQGGNLSSGGDCEIVLVALFSGSDVAYAPDLILDHLISASRLEPHYLAKLNRASSRSWVLLLERFGMNPWPAISPITLPARLLRAWWRAKPWKGPAEYIAWAGAKGLFEGRADITRNRHTPLFPK